MTCGDWSKKTDAITKRLLINKQNKSYLCFRKIPDSYNRKLTSAKIRSPSPPSRSFSFIRRLFSLAVTRSILRRSSLIRRLFSLALSRSFSSCSSVKFCRLSLSLSCAFPRCSSVKFCLLSLFLSCSLSRCSSVIYRFSQG